MNEKKIDLSDLNMTDEELFAPVNHDELESERITAPGIPTGIPCSACFLRRGSTLCCC